MISAFGSAKRLPFAPAAEQECAHGRRHAHADRRDVALDILHGVVDGHAGADAAAGAVDIQADILVGILPFQVQQLRHHKARRRVVHLIAQNDDAVIQQAGKNIIGTLPARGLFNNIRYQTHYCSPPDSAFVFI
jgi:hypothetical protein